MGHKNDFAIGPLIAVLAPFHNALVPNTTLSSLVTFPGTHTVSTSAFSPPFDAYPRNITAWISENITIGAESFSENVVGGPAQNQKSFNPAVVQWMRADSSIGWLSFYAQVKVLEAVTGESFLDLTYPDGDENSEFSFLVGTNSWQGKRDVKSWKDVEGIQVHVAGNISPDYTVSFSGLRGGAGSVIK
jgi:hypothetical protein